jgi:hypothetical protein
MRMIKKEERERERGSTYIANRIGHVYVDAVPKVG